MIKDKIQIVRNYRKAYKNYLSVLFKLYSKRRESLQNDNVMIKVVLKDGRRMDVPYGWVTTFARLSSYQNKNISNLSLLSKGISFHYKNHSVIIDPARFSDPDTVFFKEEYNFLNVVNRDVIDIGMNIGDSAIYFALNGAKRVIGLEPYPYAFSYAEKNVKLNGIKNVILLNAGYGKDSKIIVDNNMISNNASSLIESNNGGKEIPIYSLKTLVNNYEIKDGILKMDCEGCEYSLLNEDDEIIRVFRMIQIEYHYGYDKLKNKLERCGFNVRCTEPVNSYDPYAANTNMAFGYIYAER
jgi:FkbM family methyltransferase